MLLSCRQLRQAGTMAEAATAAAPTLSPHPVQAKKKWKFLQVRAASTSGKAICTRCCHTYFLKVVLCLAL